jgi:hypothetical protein
MITNLLILIITLHWSFALGMYLAATTSISIFHFLMICIMIKYFFITYGMN